MNVLCGCVCACGREYRCMHVCMTNDVYFRSGTQCQTKRANIIIRRNILSLLLSMYLVAEYRDSMNKRVVCDCRFIPFGAYFLFVLSIFIFTHTNENKSKAKQSKARRYIHRHIQWQSIFMLLLEDATVGKCLPSLFHTFVLQIVNRAFILDKMNSIVDIPEMSTVLKKRGMKGEIIDLNKKRIQKSASRREYFIN